MESIQQAAARAMVERHRGNKTAAAGALGISRKRLYTLLAPLPDTMPRVPSADAHLRSSVVHEPTDAVSNRTMPAPGAFWL
jgi:hypothetical protein